MTPTKAMLTKTSVKDDHLRPKGGWCKACLKRATTNKRGPYQDCGGRGVLGVGRERRFGVVHTLTISHFTEASRYNPNATYEKTTYRTVCGKPFVQ